MRAEGVAFTRRLLGLSAQPTFILMVAKQRKRRHGAGFAHLKADVAQLVEQLIRNQ